MINNWLKKIICIKYENILFILYLVYMIINTSKSSLFIASITIHFIMIIAIYYATYTIRQDLKEIIYNLDPIKINLIQPIKKEIFTKAFNLIPTTAQIKYNKTFLNNSIN